MKGHVDEITSTNFSPDGTIIISTSKDRTLKIWDSQTFKLLDTFESK